VKEGGESRNEREKKETFRGEFIRIDGLSEEKRLVGGAGKEEEFFGKKKAISQGGTTDKKVYPPSKRTPAGR